MGVRMAEAVHESNTKIYYGSQTMGAAHNILGSTCFSSYYSSSGSYCSSYQLLDSDAHGLNNSAPVGLSCTPVVNRNLKKFKPRSNNFNSQS
ncbi:hypothetical protein GRJ2_000484000 [Grus japonensis]|uniref:Uncharacterized protein n=1 Tax=Grus japonensis TaxID=30415 RepID=A0ABC9W7P6_GRUJA